MPQYKRPPITEAVIELRYARPVPEELCQRAADAALKDYFYREPDRATNFKIDATTGKTETEVAWTGVKLSSFDRADVALFRTTSFTASRLAPYLGWEQLRDYATRAWQKWRKIAGTMELSRIGVRYINRIDVPSDAADRVRLEDYLTIYPQMPNGPPMLGYTMQVLRDVGEDDCRLIINSGSVVSPLIGFVSFLLDLDVFRENDLPRRDEELWKFIDRMREHKNQIFESCITQQARMIFDR